MPLVNEMPPFSLATAKKGEIVEWFDDAVKEAIANALDENTDAKKPRKVILEMSILADKDRQSAIVGFSIKTKLQPDDGRGTKIFFGESMGEIRVAEEVPAEQVDLFYAQSRGPRPAPNTQEAPDEAPEKEAAQ